MFVKTHTRVVLSQLGATTKESREKAGKAKYTNVPSAKQLTVLPKKNKNKQTNKQTKKSFLRALRGGSELPRSDVDSPDLGTFSLRLA